MYRLQSELSTLTASFDEVDISVQCRIDCARLRDDYPIRRNVSLLINRLKGRDVSPGIKHKMSSFESEPTAGKVLLAILRMFNTTDTLEWSNHAKMFTPEAGRQTSWAEIGRLGLGTNNGLAFTPDQLRDALDLLQNAGYIFRDSPLNPVTKRRSLTLYFYPQVVIRDLVQLLADRKKPRNAAPLNPSQKAALAAEREAVKAAAKAATLAKRNARKARKSSKKVSVKVQAENASFCPDSHIGFKTQIIYNKDEVSRAAAHSSAGSQDGSALEVEEKKAPSEPSIFSLGDILPAAQTDEDLAEQRALNTGTPELRAAAKAIKTEFPFTRWSRKLSQSLKQRMFHPIVSQRLTPLLLTRYIRARQNMQPTEKCFFKSPEELLAFWPMVFKFLRQENLMAYAGSEGGIDAGSAGDLVQTARKLDSDLSIYVEHAESMILSYKLNQYLDRPGHVDRHFLIGALLAFRKLQLPTELAVFSQKYHQRIRAALFEFPASTLHLKDVAPDFLTQFGITSFDVAAMRSSLVRGYSRAASVYSAALLCGCDVHLSPVV